MANRRYTSINAATVIGAGTGIEIGNASKLAIQISGTTSSGTGTASADLEVTLDDNDSNATWFSVGTVSISLSATATADGFTIDAAYHAARAKLTSISGTGAAVTAKLALMLETGVKV